MTAGSRTVLGLWVLLIVLSVGVLMQMTMKTDLTALLPRSADPTQELLVSQLRDGVAARLILMALEGAPPEQLAEAGRTLTVALRQSGHFTMVNNGDPADFARERTMLMRHRYLLSDAVTAEHFSAPALREALLEQLQLLGSPTGAVTKSSLPADPTGELGHLLSQFMTGGQPQLLHGNWFSRDGTRAQLVAETRAPGFDLDAQAQALAAVDQAFHRLGLPPESRLLKSGPAVFAVDSRATIERDSWRLSLVAAGLVTALLLYVYRSPRPVLLSLLPVTTGVLAGIAAVQLAFGFVHGITLGFGATLIGETVDYPAYLFTHVLKGERLTQTLGRIWPTLRLAVLTTVFGALTMLLSNMTGLAQLGVLAVVGVLVAGLVTRWVLPALASSVPHVTARLIPVPWNALTASGRRGVWIVSALTVAAVVIVSLRGHEIWDNDLANLSPISQSARALDEQLRSDLGAPDVRYLLVVTGADREQALRRSESAVPLLRRLVADRLLSGFDLPSLYLPSEEQQRRRQAALPSAKTLAPALKQAQEGLAFRAGLFDPFLRDIEQARTGPLLTLDDLTPSALSLKIRALLIQDGARWTALAPLRGVASPEALAERITREAGAGVTFLDLKGEAERLVHRYRMESLRLTVLGVLAITGVLWWGLRSARLVVRVLLSPLIAALLVVAVLTLAGERLSLFHVVSLLLVLGIGLNYALFFNRSFADETDRRQTSLALTLCWLATLSAFGALASSKTPVLHAIGLTVGLGTACSLIVAAWLGRPDARA